MLDDLRDAIDATERRLAELERDNLDLRWFLGRLVGLIGKEQSQLTYADLQTLRMVCDRLRASDFRMSDGRCHYCEAKDGEFHAIDCPVPTFAKGESERT